jgi:hypothetical protein
MGIRKRVCVVSICLLVGSGAAVGQKVPFNPYPGGINAPDLTDALLAAVRNPAGVYRGELKGDFATLLRASSHSPAPVYADITTLHAFHQAGCRRLHVRVSQPDAAWTDPQGQQRQGREATFSLNYCTDGMPPEDPKATVPFTPQPQ